MSMEDRPLARRALLSAAASALALTAANCSADPGEAPVPSEDVIPLNRLLGAEYRLVKVYDAVGTVLRSPAAGDPNAARALVLAEVTDRWKAHHQSHATALKAAVIAARGTPVEAGSVTFSPPTEFTPSVTNAMRLAANEEQAMAVACNVAVGELGASANRFLSGTIEGDETQHFIALYVLIKQLLDPGPRFITNSAAVVSVAFVSSLSATALGLQSVQNLPYTA